MRTILYSLALLGLSALFVQAAPAPSPRQVAAEAILGAVPTWTPLVARSQIQANLQAILPNVISSSKVRQLTCLRGETDPVNWVLRHLQFEHDASKKGVRVRLEGCHPREAMTLLTAIVNAHSARMEEQRRGFTETNLNQQLLMQRIAIRGRGVPRIVQMKTETTFDHQLFHAPAVIEKPKLVTSRR